MSAVGRSRKVLTGMLTILAFVWSLDRVEAADRFVSVVGSDAANDCLTNSSPCRTIGHALTQATSGDTIKVAGGGYRENLLIDYSTTLSIAGGWTADFSSRDPAANKTRVDGGGVDRVLVIEAGPGESINFTLDSVTVTRGSVVVPAGDDDGGAGILARSLGDGSLSALLAKVTVSSNKVTLSSKPVAGSGSGGGILATSQDTSTLNLSLIDCTLTRNISEAWDGGGIAGSSTNASTLNLSLTSSNVTRNRAAAGGGIALSISDDSSLGLTMSRCSVERNHAGYGGGGLSAEEDGSLASSMTMEVTNSVFVKNKGHVNGGGMYFLGNRGNVTLESCTLTSNSAQEGGGLDTASATHVILKNVLLWGNRITVGGGVDLDMGGSNTTVSADHCDIGGRFNSGGTFNDVGGNINRNPLFLRGVHLSPGSPAIDTGTCTGAPTTDFEGDPRPAGAGCDIGADEFVP